MDQKSKDAEEKKNIVFNHSCDLPCLLNDYVRLEIQLPPSGIYNVCTKLQKHFPLSHTNLLLKVKIKTKSFKFYFTV